MITNREKYLMAQVQSFNTDDWNMDLSWLDLVEIDFGETQGEILSKEADEYARREALKEKKE